MPEAPQDQPSKSSDQPTSDQDRPRKVEAAESSPLIERNVRALVEHVAEQQRARSTADKVAGVISRFIGTMNFVYFHVVAYGLWAVIDLGWIRVIPNFDPTSTIMGTVASVEAIFITTFVVIAQNRMTAQEEVRNHLDVQVSLLTEHETTHILRLVSAMSEKMGIQDAQNPEIEELARDVEPQAIIDRIEEHRETVADQSNENTRK